MRSPRVVLNVTVYWYFYLHLATSGRLYKGCIWSFRRDFLEELRVVCRGEWPPDQEAISFVIFFRETSFWPGRRMCSKKKGWWTERAILGSFRLYRGLLESLGALLDALRSFYDIKTTGTPAPQPKVLVILYTLCCSWTVSLMVYKKTSIGQWLLKLGISYSGITFYRYDFSVITQKARGKKTLFSHLPLSRSPLGPRSSFFSKMSNTLLTVLRPP